MATTEHETRNRIRKAVAIVDVLTVHGATPAQARALPESHRHLCAELAGVTDPSPATWEMVVGLLADRQRLAAATPDPFVGISPR